MGIFKPATTALTLAKLRPAFVSPSVKTISSGLHSGCLAFAATSSLRATTIPSYMAVPPPALMSCTAAVNIARWFRVNLPTGSSCLTSWLNTTKANRVLRINELTTRQQGAFEIAEWHALHRTTDVAKKDGSNGAPRVFLTLPYFL